MSCIQIKNIYKKKTKKKKTALCDGSGNWVLISLFCHRRRFPAAGVIFSRPAGTSDLFEPEMKQADQARVQKLNASQLFIRFF